MYAPTSRLRAPGSICVDHALARHVDGLDREVQRHETDDERQQRVPHERDRQPGHQQQRQRHAGGDPAETAIGEPAGPRGTERARRTDKAEQPDRAV